MLDKIGLYTDELTFWQAAMPDMTEASGTKSLHLQNNPALAVMSESQRQIETVVPSPRLKKRLSIQSAQSLAYEDLLRVHSHEYIRKLGDLTRIGSGDAGPDAPMTAEQFEIARLSAGLVTAALESVICGEVKTSYAFCRSPGHQCLPDQAMNGCYLANIPLAIEANRHRHGHFRVAVVDWGAHHGSGTQTIYEDSADVMTISLHQEDSANLHAAGAVTRGNGEAFGTNVNIPLPVGSGHETYLRAFERIVLPALSWYKPDVIMVSCNFDAYATETTSEMLLHGETFRSLTRPLRYAANELCQGKLLFAHESRYHRPYVPYCSMAVIEELVNLPSEIVDPLLTEIQILQPDEKHQTAQNRWVDLLSVHFGY